jgi:radical SAM protein with 4Fe4S-binding SPASM domain
MVKAGLDVKIHFVAMSPNWQELGAIIDLVAPIGVTGISVLRFVPQGRGSIVKDIFSLDYEQLRGLRANIIALKKKGVLPIRVGSPFNILYLTNDVFCLAASDRAIIGSNARIYPCDAFKNIEHAGQLNSLEDGNLIDIWYNSDYLNFVRQELREAPGEVCAICFVHDKCKSGCLAQKILRLENPKSSLPDPDCLMQGGGN